MRASGASTLALLIICACADDEHVIEPGVIEFYGGQATIDVPDSFSTAQPAIVRINTYGTSCVSVERTDVMIVGDAAEIEVFDRRRTGPGICPADLRTFLHEATVVFTSAGTKQLRVHGRRVDGGIDELIQVPITIVVQ